MRSIRSYPIIRIGKVMVNLEGSGRRTTRITLAGNKTLDDFPFVS